MHAITARLHRVNKDTIDVDFQLTPRVVLTLQHADHNTAAEQVRLFNEAADKEQFVRDAAAEFAIILGAL